MAERTAISDMPKITEKRVERHQLVGLA